MNFFVDLRLHVAALLIFLPVLQAYNYEEIRKWNASCSPKDTCSVPRDLDHFDTHNCDCSSLCVLYDSCCIDSPFLNISKKYERAASCISAGESGGNVFIIDTCSANYKGSTAIRRRCEQTTKNWSDPFNNVPVTNKNTFKTYKSVFCAICNEENIKDVTMWQILIDCSALNDYMGVCTENRDFVLNNMMFVREKGLWGIWSWDSKTDWKFRYLYMNYTLPEEIKNHVKQCRPNLVSACPKRWKNDRVRHLCEAYMGAVYFDTVGFRNIHCAICNGVKNFTNMSCHGTPIEFRKPTMSFGLLLDIDLSDGDKVGNVEKKCGENEVYDPFSKKCRLIECPLPGFTLKEGKCVQG